MIYMYVHMYKRVSLPVGERPESPIKLSYLTVSLSYPLRQLLSEQNLTLSTRMAAREPLGSSYLPVLNPHHFSPITPCAGPPACRVSTLSPESHLPILSQDFLFIAQASRKLITHPCQSLIPPGPSTGII